MIGRRDFLTQCAATLALGAVGGATTTSSPYRTNPAEGSSGKTLETTIFEELLAKHLNMTYDELYAQAYVKRPYLEKVSFDPTQAAHFDAVAKKLELTDAEKAIFRKNGFVSIDRKNRYTFASAYYRIYTDDLPVLVTADSIMHALHRSYDDILMELETQLFVHAVDRILEDSHNALVTKGAARPDSATAANIKDVDLYITVARNLLAGAGAPAGAAPARNALVFEQEDLWSGELQIASKFGAGEQALSLLKDIQALKMADPDGPPTLVYGGERYFDFSQFKPRGHYAKSTVLKRYFRTLMWLGRSDCGWYLTSGPCTVDVQSDTSRELRNAVLMVELLRDTGGVQRLKAMDDIIAFMVGRSDNLTVFALLDIMKGARVSALAGVDKPALARLETAIASGKHGQQAIRSQIVCSSSLDPDKVPPPATFQLFGQRFIIDSFVLSQMVYDSIAFQGKKQQRRMPAGLDAMAALGNGEALPLLEPELKTWNYSANLMASREYVNLQPPDFWKDNLYNIWLDCLRSLDDDMSGHKNFPEAMRTKTWQMKQLQTQMGSWAELRHDTVLYAKQSYTAFFSCEYPAGYVEPYPQFYAKVKYFAQEAGRLFKNTDYRLLRDDDGANAASTRARSGYNSGALKERHQAFFGKMAETIGMLERLAEKELRAEAFTGDEKTFLKKTIDIRGGGSGAPTYDGWYCDLFYNRYECSKWDPTVVDIHTDPNGGNCLEVAVGDAQFGIIAIDNEKDRMIFVGPLFSYYEFQQPVTDRLTDQQWQDMLKNDRVPPRPAWTSSFRG